MSQFTIKTGELANHGGGPLEGVRSQKAKQVSKIRLLRNTAGAGLQLSRASECWHSWKFLLGNKLGGAEGFYGQPFIDSFRCADYYLFILLYKCMSNLSAYSCC